MLSVVDETDDDWQAVTSLGSWDDFDDFFQQKYIDSECAFRDTINAAFHLDRQ